MTHFGLLCPTATGHLNTMLPLGRALQSRGHCVTLFGLLDAEARTRSAGLNFISIGERPFPQGSTKASLAKLGTLSGWRAVQYTARVIEETTVVFLKDAPQAMVKAGVEALVVDQASAEGGAIADALGIPFITLCSAVVLNIEADIPPSFTAWAYSPTPLRRVRNQLGYLGITQTPKPMMAIINQYRQESNLEPYKGFNDQYSKLAQISQQPAEFEFPRKQLPSWFHFTGPFHSSVGREVADFPYDQLTGKPLIYASLGTIQNRLVDVFAKIASACAELDVQLIISLGASASPSTLPKLAGTPIVVKYAPQLALIKKSTVVITHAGLNTTLECLSEGVPMVAIPITNDQPGVAARIVWAGCGEALPVKHVSAAKLETELRKLLTQPAYRQNAVRLQSAIRQAGGVNRAVDIIEQAVSTRKPVIAKMNLR